MLWKIFSTYDIIHSLGYFLKKSSGKPQKIVKERVFKPFYDGVRCV